MNIQDQFSHIASQIIGSAIVVVGTRRALLITEVEFYLTEDNHPDPFTHKDPLQAQPNRFYFHRQNAKSFKGGSFKGLDITFRLRDVPTFGGILLRSCTEVVLASEDENAEIVSTEGTLDGPCKLVDRLLALTQMDNIADLVEMISDRGEVPLTNEMIKLVKICNLIIENSPRVGLTLKKSTAYNDIWVQYIMRPYRYTVSTEKVRVYKKLVDESRGPIGDEVLTDQNYKELKGLATVQQLVQFYKYWRATYRI